MTSEKLPSKRGSRDGGSNPTSRVMLILGAFATQSEWGVRELAARTSLPRSSVHRILLELADAGFLRAQAQGSYRVTPVLLRFSLDLAENFRVPRVAEPHLESARDECGETVILLMYDRGRRQVAGVAAAESINPVRFAWEATRTFTDVHVGASGKGILAFLPETEQERIIDELATTETAFTLAPRRRLIRELAQIRARGWAESVGERVPGAEGACAPVFGSSGQVIGGVLIAWPQGRGVDSGAPRLGALAARTARSISRDIGCPIDVIGGLGSA
jgi:IclR family transcriptional regulator, acetate operon repressor